MAYLTSGRSLLERVACNPVNYWATLVTDVVGAAVFAWLGVRWYSGPWVTASVLIVAGMIGWGLLEYLLHRWVLHGRVPAIKREHGRHHGQPQATISTPLFVIPICAVLLCAALSLVISNGAAAILTFGFYVGYNYFAIVHHLLHHRPSTLARSRYFEVHLRLHEIHHREPNVHFGISNSMWDRVFGTFRAR